MAEYYSSQEAKEKTFRLIAETFDIPVGTVDSLKDRSLNLITEIPAEQAAPALKQAIVEGFNFPGFHSGTLPDFVSTPNEFADRVNTELRRRGRLAETPVPEVRPERVEVQDVSVRR